MGEPQVTQGDIDVFTWRYECALDLGFDAFHAAELAASRTDLHDVERILDAGCPHQLAVRIMAADTS